MRLYNTLARKKEEFVSITPGKVLMYSCGPTVYNYFHIGNARPFIIFDTLRRYLEYLGYEVKFVQNFTDIDDKMIANANKEGITVKELANRFISEYFIDAKGLGIHEASVHPLATDNMDVIIEMVKTLEEKGYAYHVDGDVYFSTAKFEQYGKLSHQIIEDLAAGARIEVDERKRDAMDFVLWKKQKEGEPAWESPWGMGRPGWHIECSAMANRYLGPTIDIHSGGQDLIFPHHENEIAQSECANNKPFARYWLHNGYINIDNQKMSKSKGNFFTVRDVAAQYDYEVIRFFMLSAHYRSPINFSQELMGQAQSALERLQNCVDNLRFMQKTAQGLCTDTEEDALYEKLMGIEGEFKKAMDDDINTADAIAALFDMVREINSGVHDNNSAAQLERILALIVKLSGVLGLLQKNQDEVPAEIMSLAEERAVARRDKNFARSDELRDKIASLGYLVEDTGKGPKITKMKGQ